MKRKANKLKNLFDAVIRDVYLRSKTLLFQNSNQQLRKLLEGIANIEKYELQSEKLLKQPVRFLLFLRQAGVPKSKNIHKMSCSTQSEKIKTVDLIKFISEIQITEIGKRQAQNKCLLNVMPTPVLHKSIKVRGVEGVLHLSRVSSDRVWISNGRMLFLISTEGNVINILRNTVNYQWGESCSFMYNYGVHSLNNDGELIYLHLRKGVQKLSIDNRTHFKLIENLGPMDPSCVYCSLINGDIMVGAYDDYMGRGMVTRYKKSGQLIQTIQYDESDQQLYKFPAFITENNNRDVIVSDVLRYAVVVTDKEGRLRFSYTGPPRSKSHHFFYTTHRSGTILDPRGICTDALSHILVCDDNTHTVQMIDKDGHFLSLLLTEQEGIENPYSLSYDEKNHLLWIGSSRLSRVHVYRYINRRDILTGNKTSDGLK
ncbi:uncharacterized protein LOC134239544 [Saccostrea cucullata]|uniref:uncharacterized protein LOC134239544 n=1 Tax=Saccostrea cuccullata TaxID=36930 RepID=UPI002ED0658F